MALSWLYFFLVFSYSVHHLGATVFRVQNNCPQTIYAGTLSGSGPQLMNGGFELPPSAVQEVPAPAGWSGRIWGRSGCIFDPFGRGTCATGDCGGALQCNGASGAPPVSQVRITLGPTDTYDISLEDGFNIGISIAPTSGTGDCSQVKCVADLNAQCPDVLKKLSGGAVVGCKSACAAFGKPEDCCTEDYGIPGKCKPTTYSKYFKAACPQASSYAGDNSSIFTCSGADYTITLC